MSNWYDPLNNIRGNYSSAYFSMVYSFSMFFSNQDKYNMEINISVQYANNCIVDLKIIGCKYLKINEICNSFLQFQDFFIDDIRKDGMEGIRYQMISECNEFKCYFYDIIVLKITKEGEVIYTYNDEYA